MTVLDTLTKTEHIAVGFDGSPDGELALRFALGEAVLRGVELRVICSYDLTPGFSSGAEMAAGAWQFVAASAKEEVARAMRIVHEEVAGAVEVTGVCVPGRPAHVLLEHSRQALMLVVGSRRLGGVSRMFLGSTSTELIHHSDVPVIVVPYVRDPTTDPTSDPDA